MQKINIDIEFAQCVRNIKGQVLDDILDKPTFKNADYWFPEYKTIAELKRFDKDLLSKREFKAKINDLANSWVKRGLIPKF